MPPSDDPLVLACLHGDAAAVAAADRAELDRVRAELPDLLSQAAGRQHWEVVRALAGAGFEIGRPGPGGASPVHLAAGSGALDALRALVERDADLAATDPQFQATPLGWAEYFGQQESAAYLAGLPR
ncbi:MAG TPA: ankyrin repeat domain-containing protein [Kribbellaceae bacterium]|nr:ankyrin repeat domain-containing protein [Kribbellaceae bacterium]